MHFIGYNDSPNELGEPSGFWLFDDYDTMITALDTAESLNRTFDTMGAPTYSALFRDADGKGQLLFFLLVISAKPVRPRREILLDKAREWLETTPKKEKPPAMGGIFN